MQRPRPISTASLPTSPFPKELAPGSNWGRIEEGFAFYSPAKRVSLKPHQFSFDSMMRFWHFLRRRKWLTGSTQKPAMVR